LKPKNLLWGVNVHTWSLFFYITVMTLCQLQNMYQLIRFVSGRMNDDVTVVWKDACLVYVRV